MEVHFRLSPKGFTIIELLVIIIVISVIAAFVSFKYPGTSLTLPQQTQRMGNDLLYTQTLSMTQGNRYCLVMNGNTYQIINSATNTALSLALGNTTVTLASGLSFGTILPANTAMIVFNGQGTPYYSAATSCSAANAAAATQLVTTGSIPITNGSITSTVFITPYTGSVLVQ